MKDYKVCLKDNHLLVINKNTLKVEYCASCNEEDQGGSNG